MISLNPPTLYNIVEIIKLISLISGVSIVTITELIIFKFLKDFEITVSENKILKKIEKINWLVIFTFLISSLYLLLIKRNHIVDHKNLNLVPQIIMIVIIMINSWIYFLKTLADLKKYRLNPNCIRINYAKIIRRLAFFQGLINVISWYFIFYLFFVLKKQINLQEIFKNYFYILLILMIVIQIFVTFFDKRSRQKQI